MLVSCRAQTLSVKGGPAVYNPVLYEVQVIASSITAGQSIPTTGFFTLSLNRTGVNLWGGVNTSVSLAANASAVDVKRALEGV